MASESGSAREDDMTSSGSGVPAILGDGEVHEGVRLLTCVTPTWSALTPGSWSACARLECDEAAITVGGRR
jgi:hypothetical protein